ncbi:MAG: transketolase, partial [Actinobacteria bacterium]|nr:transketolase [Actinomycetota bacterium]
MIDTEKIKEICRIVRYHILTSTTKAGSGHPSSSLSSVELVCTLMFGGFFRFRINDPGYEGNHRLIFSKGHAAPLLYAVWAAAGAIPEDKLLTLRRFDSILEGHPTPEFKYSEAATGSLGQGLSIGLGMALNSKYIDKIPYNTYVLLGDSEMTEGSQWEAVQIASHYKIDNLTGILDVNRLGQRGETIYGRNTISYEKILRSFGWDTEIIDGHNIDEISAAFLKAEKTINKPFMIIANTIKGKGVSFLEDKEGWHGTIIPGDRLKSALEELGPIDRNIKAKIKEPEITGIPEKDHGVKIPVKIPQAKDRISTRKAYGNALVNIFKDHTSMVVLDAEVSNSTYSEIFKKAVPGRFFEMFIAEQNMV